MYYTVEVINKELLAAVLTGKLTKEDANNLRRRMLKKRKRNLIGTIICVVIFAICTVGGLNYETFKFPDEVMIGIIIGIFAAFFIVIFMINGLSIALSYLRALKKSYPEIN